MWWVAGKMYQEETTCLFDYISPNVKAIRTSYFITKEGRVIVAKAKLFDEVEVGACGTGRKVVFRGPWVKFGTVSWFPRKYYEDTERFAPMIEPIMAERRQRNAWQSALFKNTEAVTEFLKNQYGLTRSDIYEWGRAWLKTADMVVSSRATLGACTSFRRRSRHSAKWCGMTSEVLMSQMGSRKKRARRMSSLRLPRLVG